MARPARMGFGIFLAPFHPISENPTLALKRDLQLIQWLDELGYDEAWIGEHHSAGWETIASPEVFIGVAAERTRRIRLGTGVISLPYHHPLMVANRMVLLDHLTEGRVMLGVGPGALISDAHILGIDPNRQRERMDEALGIIMRLLTETEPITYKSDWFELHDATLQLRSFTRPHLPVTVASVQSPAGMLAAGKYGIPPLSIGVRTGVRGPVSLPEQWRICQETAAEHGRVVRREDWRLVMPIHLAESREEAIAEARAGVSDQYWEYFHLTNGHPMPAVDSPSELIDRFMEAGSIIVGTPDDCIAGIERLQEISGGFGTLLVQAHEWATREKTNRSYELLARYVMPRFQDSLAGIQASNRWVRAHRDELYGRREASIERAFETYEQKTGVPG
jgi:limonene 1,2-monooxygenase